MLDCPCQAVSSVYFFSRYLATFGRVTLQTPRYGCYTVTHAGRLINVDRSKRVTHTESSYCSISSLNACILFVYTAGPICNNVRDTAIMYGELYLFVNN
jgi:hypothetical protein